MQATRLAFFLSVLAAACSSSSQEQPVVEQADLVVSASCSHQEDTVMLAVAVTNRGKGAAAPAAARVEFNGDPASGVVRQTRFIGAHAVQTFDVELPAVCSKIACLWDITVDSPKPARESGRC